MHLYGFQILHEYLLGQCIPLVIKGFCLYKLAVCSYIVFVLPACASSHSSFIIHPSASLKWACLSPHMFLSPPDLGSGQVKVILISVLASALQPLWILVGAIVVLLLLVYLVYPAARFTCCYLYFIKFDFCSQIPRMLFSLFLHCTQALFYNSLLMTIHLSAVRLMLICLKVVS